MQNIGPDMDDLFRLASEEYPLIEGPDNWSEIQSRINPSVPAIEPEKSLVLWQLLTRLALITLCFLLATIPVTDMLNTVDGPYKKADPVQKGSSSTVQTGPILTTGNAHNRNNTPIRDAMKGMVTFLKKMIKLEKDIPLSQNNSFTVAVLISLRYPPV